MICPKCHENGEDVDMEGISSIIGDIDHGLLCMRCPVCYYEVEADD